MKDWIRRNVEVTDAMQACYAGLDPRAPEDYRQLAALLASEWQASPPRRVGLGGGQGAGKSTLGRLLEAACASMGLRACVLGLDDFYLTRPERRALAERVHPLLETRGPPGTHDVIALVRAMDALAGEGAVSLPVFDKAIDDRAGFRSVRGPFDLVVLEGWCVGAMPLDRSALDRPLNDLEAEEDPHGSWRGFVADRLEVEYARLWAAFDAWVWLRVPNLDCVRRWRLEQESERPVELRMSAAQVDRFVQHYERVTLSMASQQARPGQVSVVLGEGHEIVGLERQSPVAAD